MSAGPAATVATGSPFVPSVTNRHLIRDQDLHFIGGGPFLLYHPLAISQVIFAFDMTIYYCHSLEDALKRAKKAGKRPGCRYCGIVLKNGKRGFAIYKEGVVIEQYSVIGR